MAPSIIVSLQNNSWVPDSRGVKTFGTGMCYNCILITMALVIGHFDDIYLNHPPRPCHKRVSVAKLMGISTRLTCDYQNCVSC